jgi:hypothetical protein
MKITNVPFAVLLCVGALFSQGGLPPGPPPDGPQTDQVKAYLVLSDQQLKDLGSIQDSFRAAAEPLMQQIGEKARALRQALRQNPVDSALVTQLKADIASLQAQESSLRATYRAQAQSILIDQQKTSLASLQQALDLMPAALQATALNLLDAPQGFPGGPRGPR